MFKDGWTDSQKKQVLMKNTEPGTFSQPNRWLDGAVVYNTYANLNIQ